MPDDVNLQGVSGVGGMGVSPAGRTQGSAGGDGSFRDMLFQKIEEVNSLQREAEAAMSNLAERKTENVTEVLVAVQKADLAFKTLMQLRNKLFEAYREINQLRI
ncbi:MAG TPA: flagellar hook-basal body complex protein FliE [Planctomycetota bacterium]|nr:flagellar hook-basal body complex protein FliE [Planctomycetota bacterium]